MLIFFCRFCKCKHANWLLALTCMQSWPPVFSSVFAHGLPNRDMRSPRFARRGGTHWTHMLWCRLTCEGVLSGWNAGSRLVFPSREHHSCRERRTGVAPLCPTLYNCPTGLCRSCHFGWGVLVFQWCQFGRNRLKMS